MMKMFRVFSVSVLLLMSMFAISAQAALVPVTIDSVWINDRLVGAGEVRGDINRGDRLDVEVKLRATSNAENLRVAAEITGFDQNDDEEVRDQTDLFDVKAGQVYFKTVSLRLPSDIDRDSYALRIEVTDRRNQKVTWDVTVDVNAPRRSMEIKDVVFSPGLTVKSGRSLLASVRVENNGVRDEDSVKISFSIPDLGVSDSDFVDELKNDDKKTSEELFVRIPDCTEAGNYAGVVSVEYDNSHKKVTKDYTIRVLGDEKCGKPAEKTVISAGPETQNVIAGGSEVVYPIVLTNAGSESRTYTVLVNAGDWASSRVSSSVVVLGAGETKAVQAYVAAKKDAPNGTQTVTVSVKSGEQTLKDIALHAQVTGTRNTLPNVQVGLIVLLALVIIVALIVAFSRWKGNEGEGKEETYY